MSQNPPQSEPFDPAAFAQKTGKDMAALESELAGHIASIQNKDIKRLLEAVFSGEFLRQYCTAAAAKSYHHGYAGGLLEHSIGMVRIAKAVCGYYSPRLDEDLLVAGCILHDVGKVKEYSCGKTVSITDEGKMIGHIAMGAKMVEDRMDQLGGFPADLKTSIIHMILSHHGYLEYGSPVMPAFAEAVALHKIDSCDASIMHEIKAQNFP